MTKSAMLKIKAVFFDIDGTLIRYHTHDMPTSTLEALKVLRQKGIKLFLATGRAPKSVEFMRDYFDFDGVIAFNGQYCFDKEEVLFEKAISRQSILSVLPYLTKKQIASSFETVDGNFFNIINDRVYDLIRLVGVNEPDPQTVDIATLKQDVYQMTVYVNSEEEAELMKWLPDCRALRWCRYQTFINIVGKDGGKSVGISKVCEKYGLKINELMAFGDGGNDIDMLQYVGTGVAMGNAADSVKQVANYVTDDVGCDGVYKALKHFEIIYADIVFTEADFVADTQ